MWKTIIKTGLIAGTLDITAACVNAYVAAEVLPSRVLQYVASGMFGKAAFEGGYGMMAWGLFFHFIIAFSCAACFFLLYPEIKLLRFSWVLNAIAIGIVAWIVTTQIIVPVSQIGPQPFDMGKAAKAALILVVCIGLPIAFSAKRYFGTGKS